MRVTLIIVTHQSPQRTDSHEWKEAILPRSPTFPKYSPSILSPVCSKKNESFSFQMSSFYFIFWILLSPGQSHLAAPQHCHGHFCVKSEQKVQGTFSIIRITQTFTLGNLSQLGYEQQSHLDLFFSCCRKISWHFLHYKLKLNRCLKDFQREQVKKTKQNTLRWQINDSIWNRKKNNI